MNGYLMNKCLFNDIVRVIKVNVVSKLMLGFIYLVFKQKQYSVKAQLLYLRVREDVVLE